MPVARWAIPTLPMHRKVVLRLRATRVAPTKRGDSTRMPRSRKVRAIAPDSRRAANGLIRARSVRCGARHRVDWSTAAGNSKTGRPKPAHNNGATDPVTKRIEGNRRKPSRCAIGAASKYHSAGAALVCRSSRWNLTTRPSTSSKHPLVPAAHSIASPKIQFLIGVGGVTATASGGSTETFSVRTIGSSVSMTSSSVESVTEDAGN